MMKPILAAGLIYLSATAAWAADPALPSGLFDDEPSLPAGIESSEEVWEDDWGDDDDSSGFELSGFAETRIGTRLQHDNTQRNASIGEARLQLDFEKQWDAVTASVTADFLYDPVLNRHQLDLETGQGWMDIREANLLFRPTNYADVKLGRQVLTWGTGDLIFINDLFSKDWNSFFTGRDEEYLKAPSDALKVALFSDLANLDIVYTPRFDSDRHIDGHRISYFSNNANAIVGQNQPILTDSRAAWFDEDEIALRLHRVIGSFETALYFYDGYWKSPNGQDASSGLFLFPELSVYGASIRGTVGGGIIHAETGYYQSHDDSNGNNPLIRNSEWRFLAGYEHEIAHELTGSVQYYLEHMDDYSAYRANLPAGAFAKDENRHLFTLRLTQMLMNQNLTLSLFNFYSPSDKDGYVRSKAHYKIDDSWSAEMGGNIFYGRHNHTFFGGFEDNSNAYVALRYGF